MLLWGGVLWLGIKTLGQGPWNQPLRVFRELKSYAHSFGNKKQKSARLTKKLERWSFFTTPGWIISHFCSGEALQLKLLQSGVSLSLKEFLAIKQLVIWFASIYFWIYLFFGEITLKNSLLLLGVLMLLFFIPDLWLQVQKEKRQKSFELQVPYFIDLLSLTLETGMGLERSMVYVSQEMQGTLAQEIRRQLQGLEYGISFEAVLSKCILSVGVEEFSHFISNLRQAKKLGVSLSQTLRIQSELINTRRQQKAEELSRTASVKISVPLVLFVFPALLIIYLGPVILQMS